MGRWRHVWVNRVGLVFDVFHKIGFIFPFSTSQLKVQNHQMQRKKTLRMKMMALDQLKKWMKIQLLVSKSIFLYYESYQCCRGESISRASDVRSFGCSNKKFGQGEVLVNGWCLQWKLFYKTSYFLSYFVGCELLNKFLLSEAKKRSEFCSFINNSHVSTSNQSNLI